MFDEALRQHAAADNAYLFHFPDGRVSLELEWLDIRELTRTVVSAYLASSTKRREPE